MFCRKGQCMSKANKVLKVKVLPGLNESTSKVECKYFQGLLKALTFPIKDKTNVINSKIHVTVIVENQTVMNSILYTVFHTIRLDF